MFSGSRSKSIWIPNVLGTKSTTWCNRFWWFPESCKDGPCGKRNSICSIAIRGQAMENGTLEAQIRSFTVAKAWESLRKSCGVLWNPVEIRGLPREARPHWGLQSRQRPGAVRFCGSYEWSAAGGGGRADFPPRPCPLSGRREAAPAAGLPQARQHGDLRKLRRIPATNLHRAPLSFTDLRI